jgi:hypothetical protein
MQKNLTLFLLFCLFNISLSKAQTPDANGIVYVTPTGSGNGSSWSSPTSDLQGAINSGATKVFVAIGNYDAPTNSFSMKNGVAIYGGFDPLENIKTLADARKLPSLTMPCSVLNGQTTKRVIFNNFTAVSPLNSTAVLDGFTITGGNSTFGSGMYNVYASPTLNNLVIKDNVATISGGGIATEYGSPILTNVVISGNTVTATGAGRGGGMYNYSSDIILQNVIVADNTVSTTSLNGFGGGIYSVNNAPKLTNVSIVNNTVVSTSAFGVGGAMFNNNTNSVFTNVTIANNQASSVGGGISNQSATITIDNSILWGNKKNGSTTIAGADIENGTLTVRNSITQVYNSGNPLDNNKVGTNPLFVNTTDFSLQNISPAINSGDNALFPSLNTGTKDLAGNQRLVGATIDMGAYEFTHSLAPDAGGIIYIKETATGNGVGSDWANATSDLHNAIYATSVTKVFVAKGTYNVGDNSFIMKNGVEIYGGFDPDNNIKTLNDSRVLPNAFNSNGSILNGQNVRPVIWNVFTSGTALNTSAVLDGFTLTNGAYSNGAGVRNVYASPTFRNLVIRTNTATASGAGMYNENSSPVITNTVISNNSISSSSVGAVIYGAGVHNSASSAPVFTNVTLTSNSLLAPIGTVKGTAIYNNNSSPIIQNSIIWDNLKNGSTAISGADIQNEGSGTITLKNSITQTYTTGNASDKNKTGANPLFTGGAYELAATSPAINSGDNLFFTGLVATTIDLAGNPRLSSQYIDMGAYEYQTVLAPDANGIIYVKENATGNGTGTSWANATYDLHNAISTAGVSRVFAAVGNYPVGSSSFVMKNNVEIYGGFDPDNGITNLTHNRILPNKVSAEGSVLNGQNARTVIWNDGNALNTTALLDGFTIKNGTYTGGLGGGIRNVGSSAVYQNLVIKDNTAKDGAGIYVFGGSPNFINLIIQDNTASEYGGGIYSTGSSSSKINNAIIKGNISASVGAGFFNNQYSSPVVTNVLITGNRAQGYDAANGAFNSSGYVELRNVTIAGNTPNNYGNNIALQTNGGTFSLSNSIVFGSTSGGNINFKQSFLQGNSNTSNGNRDASGIVETDIFTNPSSGDYTLKSGSVAIDVGDEDLYAGLDANTKDLAGNARVYQFSGGGVLDLGAYESSYNAFPYVALTPDANGIIYVKETATGSKNGSSWNDATDKLSKAILTNGVQQVWASTGTYVTKNVKLKNNVTVYGGFDPNNGIDDITDIRILPNFNTITEGSVINAQNSGAVLFNNNNGINNTAILDGFTLTNGRNDVGAGIYNNAASPTLRNLWIKGNIATSDGGGIYNINSSSPIMSNITISGNTAAYAGGIFNKNGSSPMMNNVIIKNNTANNDGGGMYNDASSLPQLTNVSITGNTAQNGAGMYNRTNSSPVLTNAIIANNTATIRGGAIRNEATSSPKLVNVTIANNGGSNAIYATNGSTIINNSIVFGTVSASYTAQYSLIEGDAGGTNGNLDGTTFAKTQVFTDNDNKNYTLKSTSPTINTGNNSLNATANDLAGNPRLYNSGTIDMGAYEYQGAPVLPITLISFTAKAEGNHAKLQWQTASEKDNDKFVIYRSGDEGLFVKIGEQPTKPSGNYHFTDFTPLNGNNYYKLVQIDQDGKTTEIGVRTLNFGLAKLDIQVYPNPTHNLVTLSFAPASINEYQVLDVSGKILQRGTIHAQESSKTLSLGNYPSGVYLIKLKGNTLNESIRVIKR